MDVFLGLTAGAIIGLLLLSAFFSGSETALIATSKARMHELRKRGERRAGVVSDLQEKPQRVIAAILLGNNLVNILASALATGFFLEIFGQAGIFLATLVMTVMVLLFGELLPKTYAINHPDRFALAIAPVMRMLVSVFAPVVFFAEIIVQRILKFLDPGSALSDGQGFSAHDELRGAIDLHHLQGAVLKKDRDMLGGILNLRELELTDVMVHRTKMHMIDIARPLDDIISDVLNSGFTRVPVWRGNPDNIIGILHARDLLASLQSSKGDTTRIDIGTLLSRPWFVPDSTAVADQLSAFLRSKSPFAIVVDEYGEVMGLVTLEDILEEIVGEIADEHDVAAPGVTRETSGSLIVTGTTPVRDLNRLYEWRLPDEEATTIAGLVIHEARMIPDQGQSFTFHGFRFEILERRKNRLTSLRITRLAGTKQIPAGQ